jgi:hypothetical protein
MRSIRTWIIFGQPALPLFHPVDATAVQQPRSQGHIRIPRDCANDLLQKTSKKIPGRVCFRSGRP